MESEVAVEVKNLAISLISITKFSLMQEAVEDFKKQRVARKDAEEKSKAAIEKRRKEEEEDLKNWTQNRTNELLANKNRQEKLKKKSDTAEKELKEKRNSVSDDEKEHVKEAKVE